MGHWADCHLAEMAALDRPDRRNGTYQRRLTMVVGDAVLAVKRTRTASAVEILAANVRRAPQVDRGILDCFLLGASTRNVGRILAPLLGQRISASTVSHIAINRMAWPRPITSGPCPTATGSPCATALSRRIRYMSTVSTSLRDRNPLRHRDQPRIRLRPRERLFSVCHFIPVLPVTRGVSSHDNSRNLRFGYQRGILPIRLDRGALPDSQILGASNRPKTSFSIAMAMESNRRSLFTGPSRARLMGNPLRKAMGWAVPGRPAMLPASVL